MAPRLSHSLGLALATVAPLVAYSQTFLTEDQAAKQMLPSGEIGTRKVIELTPQEIKTIEERSGETVRNTGVVAWVDSKKNVVFVDQVLGKHEFITYAVGVSKAKTVSSLEILEYRETYGGQVRQEDWKKQFYGKDSAAPLKLGKDIVNISGATLSSAHVTAGVRRLLQTYELIRARL
jgi:Na+-translocating ferredoxin:NAD+ oxidoreductase RnfG subunit